MADAAAPAAPAGGTPAATPPATSGGAPAGSAFSLNWDSLDEDSQIVEQMRAEHAAGTLKADSPAPNLPKPPETANPDAATPPKAGRRPRSKDGKFQPATSGASQTAAPGASDATAASATAPAATAFETPQAAVDAITAAFEAQDIDKLAELTGKPRAFFEAGDAKWAAFRSEKQEHRRAVQAHQQAVNALETTRGNIEAQRASAAAEYGAAIRAASAYKKGDFEAFVALVQELTGDPYDTAQANVIQGALSGDPQTKRLRQQMHEQAQELAELKRKDAAREAAGNQTREQQHQQAYQNTVAALETDLGTHEAKRIKNYQNEILARVRDSWDGKAYTLSFVDAADDLVADRDEELAARGYARAPQLPAAPAARQLPAALPPRGRAASSGAETRPRWETEDLSEDEVIESLKQDHKAGRLR